MSVSTAGVSKFKDGVPQWDGAQADFQEYYEMCQLWEASTPWHKRYLNGPRLASELQGSARRLILGKPANWLSEHGGTEVLLEHLRIGLGKPQLSELSDYLQKYFRQSKRRPGESMGDYVTKKCEVYLRAQQAYHRVKPHHTPNRTSTRAATAPAGYTGRRNSWESDASTPNPTTDGNDTGGDDASTAATTTEQGDHPWWTGVNWWQTGQSANWWQSPGWWSRPSESWSSRSQEPLEELLPDYIQGWLLLQDAGLDAEQRNLVVTAVRGNFAVATIAQEWSEQDLRRRDHGARHSGYMGEAVEEDPELEEDYEPYEEILVAEGMNEEGLWAMQEAYREQDEAYAALQVAKQTLREARAKQKFVKLSRQYYGKSGTGKGAGKSKSKGQSSGSRDDSAMQCLACGKIGHRAANCPKPSGTEDHNESAPFVCYLDTDQDEALMANSLSTQDAITAGMAVIDGGATKTVASVAAVEALMDRNQEVRGTNGLRSVDTGNRPIFSFGNSSANQCVSTAQVDGKPGTLNIHAIRGRGRSSCQWPHCEP